MTLAAWSRLPAELRGLRQWVLAGPDKTPLSVDASGKLYGASSVDPSQWLPFEAAVHFASQYGYGIGFMLHKDDPFTCIDFDVCDIESQKRKGQPIDESKWTTPEQWNYFWEVIAQPFDSYTEVSMWGKGLHVWVRGKLPGTGKGIRNGSLEMYSQERYIICTGNVVIDNKIRDRQEWLTALAEAFVSPESGKVSSFELVELPQVLSDDAVMSMAWEAENKFNFQELWYGRWQQFGHPSQSEADMALMSMFTFYSQSNEQCRRLFRMSALGKREKAVKNDRYLNFTLSAIRAREAREKRADISGIQKSAEALLQLNRERSHAGHTLHDPQRATGQPQPSSVAVSLSLAAPISPAAAKAADNGLPWPPGLTGAIAQFIYNSAPRPVKEVAIVGALGLLAGICGKTWYIPGSGLNLYIILVARSAVGKEAMHSGVSALVQAAAQRAPSVHGFVNFTDFASGPALIKACATQSSFVQVAGEWGQKLRALAQDNSKDTASASLRRVMTDLYQKSGPQSIVGGINYSQAEGNIASINGVAFSMIGETTPKTFYTALTETMMEDGFLSRFTIVEYEGDRPPLNSGAQSVPDQALADAIGDLVNKAQTPNRVPVNASPGAAQLFHDFEKECDIEINSTKDESWRQMWNRASLKVMRVSALLAVADNAFHPCVEPHHVLWALELIRRDIAIMKARLESGEIGSDDQARERRALAVIKDYFQRDISEGYGIPPAMRENGIIPYKIVQIRCQRSPAFVAHRAGSTEAVKQVMNSLVQSGYLMDVQKDAMVQAYNFHGKCYRLLNLPDFDKQRRA